MQHNVSVRQEIMLSLAQTAATGRSFFQGGLLLFGVLARTAHSRAARDVVSEVVLPHDLHHPSPPRLPDEYFGSQHCGDV